MSTRLRIFFRSIANCAAVAFSGGVGGTGGKAAAEPKVTASTRCASCLAPPASSSGRNREKKSACALKICARAVRCHRLSGVAWSGVEWSGVEWSGVEWSGVEWGGVEWQAVSQCSAPAGTSGRAAREEYLAALLRAVPLERPDRTRSPQPRPRRPRSAAWRPHRGPTQRCLVPARLATESVTELAVASATKAAFSTQAD